jgi:RecA-family ATPase
VNYLEAKDIELVIMDSFKDFFIGDPTNAEHMAAYCGYKTEIKNRTGIALATLAHSTKGSVNDFNGGNEYGIIKGDQRLLADADSIVMFSRANQPDVIKFRQDKLRGAIKMGDVMKLQMMTDEQNRITFKFISMVNAELEVEQNTTDRIMGVLNRASEAMSVEGVLEELKKYNKQVLEAGRKTFSVPTRETVRMVLNRQRDRGFVVSNKIPDGTTHVYMLASRYVAPEPAQTLPMEEEISEEDRESILAEMEVA